MMRDDSARVIITSRNLRMGAEESSPIRDADKVV